MNAEAYLTPLTLCGGMIEGAEQWESYKALRRAMKTGRAQDARAVGEAILKDMSDPQKAKAYTDGIRRAEIGLRAAEILKRDRGKLARMMKEAGKAFREAKEAQRKIQDAHAKWSSDYQRHLEAVDKLCSHADAEALRVIEETSKAIAGYRSVIEQQRQTYMEKREEADRLYQSAMNMAAAKAKREMMMDAEQARKKRNKLNGQGNIRAEQEAQEKERAAEQEAPVEQM